MMVSRWYRYTTLFTAVIWMAGCSSKPVTTPQLKTAHEAFKTLESNRTYAQKAPLALIQADKIYTLSQKAKNKTEADHYAYLLEREVEVTREKAREADLKAKISSLEAARQKALLDAKETELMLLKKQIDQTQAKLKELEALNARETSRGLVLTLGDVLFESGKANLLPGAERTLEKLVQFLEENPDRKVLIEGHTDNIGSSTYNLDLSLRRAQAVQKALIERGIEESRILAQGYGELYPVASNKDAAGRQRNRRVEIVILKEGVEPEKMQR